MFHQLPHRQRLRLLLALHLPGPHPRPLPRYLFSHSDRIFLWSTNGPDHRQSAGGYSFSLTWRSALPGVHASALGIFNFKTGPNSILSFRAELQNMTISRGAVLLEPKGTQAGIVFLAFSLVIVTQDTNYLELVVLSLTNLTPGSDPILNANSSKFSFGGNASSPISSYFFQWVTGQDYSYSSTSYRARIYFYTSNSSSGEIQVQILANSNIYMTGVKVVVFLASKAIGGKGTRFFKQSFSTYYSVSTNLGVPAREYGQPSTGRSCIFGLYEIEPQFYNSNSYSSRTISSYLFSYNGSQAITGSSYSYFVTSYFTTLCLAQCPEATYFDGLACVNCNASMPNCTACTSASTCVSCSSPLIRNYDSNVCECPPHSFLNSSASTCGPCPFDCYTCSGNGTCLTCSNFR